MPKLYHPTATSCSFAGKAYTRARDGSFNVPDEAVVDLVASHGFTPTAPKPEEPEKLQKDG